MARMKIVLRESVDNVGTAGEIVTVAGGFARNFLIPRGLAFPATAGYLRQAEVWRAEQEAKEEQELNEARSVQGVLESSPLRIPHQAGPDGRLFGSITNAEVAQAIRAAHGLEIDRHAIELGEAIRHLGFHDVSVSIHPEISATVTIEAVEAG